MAWPQANEFQEAVQNPHLAFGDPELRASTAKTNALGLPHAVSGQFGIVYEMKAADGRCWAVKCFTGPSSDRQRRYQAIGARLKQVNLPFMVGIDYLEQGIRIQGQWYPILKMDWVEGQTLNEFVGQRVDQPHLLEGLLDMWVKVAQRLRETDVTHADLQHGNVMLIPGIVEGKVSLRLVDYDGMYLPALAGLPSGEMGHRDFQHPKRLATSYYGPEVDRFSHLVIYTALLAVREKGKVLWDKYSTGDNLLFTQADFANPGSSKILLDLWREGSDDLRTLTGRLVLATRQSLKELPDLSEVVGQHAVVPLKQNEIRAVDRILLGESRQEKSTTDNVKVKSDKPKATAQAIKSAPRKESEHREGWMEYFGNRPARLGIVAGVIGILLFAIIVANAPWDAVSDPVVKENEKADAFVAANDLKALPPVKKTPDKRQPVSKGEKGDNPPSETPMGMPDDRPKAKEGSVEPAEPKKKEDEPPPEVKKNGEELTVEIGPQPREMEVAENLPKSWNADVGTIDAALSGDGSRLAVIQFNQVEMSQVLRILNVETGEPIRELKNPGKVGRVAISGDGKRVLSSDIDGVVKLWNVDSGALLWNNRDFGGPVAFSGDGKRFAFCSSRNSVNVVDSSLQRLICNLRGHVNNVRCIALSSDGKRLVSGSVDTTVRVWDAQTGKEIHTLAHKETVTEVAICGDGSKIAAKSAFGSWKIWNAKTGAEIQNLDNSSSIGTIALSNDGEWFAIAHGSSVVLWDVKGGSAHQTLKGKDLERPESTSVLRVAFSSDRKRVVCVGSDGSVNVWELGAAAKTDPPKIDVPKTLPPVDEMVQDRDKLKGAWTDKSKTRRLEFAGEKFTRRYDFGAVSKPLVEHGTYRLKVGGPLKEIDFQFTDGSAQGLTAKGIYRFDGERLQIVLPGPGEERPTAFQGRYYLELSPAK